jgi:hypothetical protein
MFFKTLLKRTRKALFNIRLVLHHSADASCFKLRAHAIKKFSVSATHMKITNSSCLRPCSRVLSSVTISSSLVRSVPYHSLKPCEEKISSYSKFIQI